MQQASTHTPHMREYTMQQKLHTARTMRSFLVSFLYELATNTHPDGNVGAPSSFSRPQRAAQALPGPSKYPCASGVPRFPQFPGLRGGEGGSKMSLIRSDLSVAPSYSRSGKTAASASQQAMGKLKQELETSNRKAARSKVTDTLKDSHKEILSKVLDHSITGVPPSYGTAAVSREQDLCSSPREPSTW